MSPSHSLRRGLLIVSLVVLAASSRRAFAVTIDSPAGIELYPGQTASFVVTLHAVATFPATEAITFTATLPAGITAMTLPDGSCQTTGNSVGCTASLSGTQRLYPVVTISPSAAYGSSTNIPLHVSSPTDSGTSGHDASLTIQILGPNDMVVSAVDPPASLMAGTTTPITFRIENHGTYAGRAAIKLDALYTGSQPPMTGFTAQRQTSGPPFTCAALINAAPNQPIAITTTCTASSPLAPGASATFVIDYYADPYVRATQQLAILATTNVDSFDTNPSNNRSQVNFAITTSSNASMTLTAPATAVVGDYITVQATASTAGPSDTGSADATYDVPPGAEFVSVSTSGKWAFGCTTPAVGASGRVTCRVDEGPSIPLVRLPADALTVNVTMKAATATTLAHHAAIASAAGGSPDPDLSNNAASASTVVSASTAQGADVALAVAASAVQPSAPFTYTLTATNVSNVNATNVVLTDVLPSQVTFVSATGPCSGTTTVTCSIGTLAAHASFPVTITVTAPDQSQTITNVATLTAANDVNASNNSVTTSLLVPVVPGADIAVVLPHTTIQAGVRTTVTVTISNRSAANLATATLAVKLPHGLTGTFPQFPTTSEATADGGTLLTIQMQIFPQSPHGSIALQLLPDAGTPVGTVFPLHAELTGKEPDSNPADNISDGSVIVVALTTPPLDVGVNFIVTPQSVAVGDHVLLDATVVPVTGDAIPAVTLSIDLRSLVLYSVTTNGVCTPDAGRLECRFPAFTAPTSSDHYPHVSAVAIPPVDGTFVLTAATQLLLDDVDRNNNNSVAHTLVVVPASPPTHADLDVALSGNSLVLPGDTATTVIKLTNHGPDAAAATSLYITLDSGLTFNTLQQASATPLLCNTPTVGASGVIRCALNPLPNGATSTFTLTTIASTAASNTALSIDAVASTKSLDPQSVNNHAVLSLSVLAGVDNAIAIQPSALTVPPQGIEVYHVEATNRGTLPAHDVVLTVNAPAGAAFGRVAASSGLTCGSTLPLVCHADVLASTAVVSLDLSVTMPAAVGRTVTTATVTSSDADHDPASNSAEAAVTVVAPGRRRAGPH